MFERGYVEQEICKVTGTNISIYITEREEWIVENWGRIYGTSEKDRQRKQNVSWIVARYPELLTFLIFLKSFTFLFVDIFD